MIRQVLRKTPANAMATPRGDQRRLIKGSTRLRERPARNAHRQPAAIGTPSTGYSNSSAKGHMEEQAMYRNLNAFMGFYLGFAMVLIVAL